MIEYGSSPIVAADCHNAYVHLTRAPLFEYGTSTKMNELLKAYKSMG